LGCFQDSPVPKVFAASRRKGDAGETAVHYYSVMHNLLHSDKLYPRESQTLGDIQGVQGVQ